MDWAYGTDVRTEIKSHPPNYILTADLGLFCHQVPLLHAGSGQSLNYIEISHCSYPLVKSMLLSHFCNLLKAVILGKQSTLHVNLPFHIKQKEPVFELLIYSSYLCEDLKIAKVKFIANRVETRTQSEVNSPEIQNRRVSKSWGSPLFSS